MYFTSFHRAIFKKIWRSQKSKEIFDLETFLKFYNKWVRKKYRRNIYKTKSGEFEEFIFSGYESNPDMQYIIKEKNREKVALAFKELESVLNYLCKNDLINIVEKEKPQCISLYVRNKNKTESFVEALEIARKYVGKNIQVREGYKKFRLFRFRTKEEILRFLVSIWLPVFIALLTVVLQKLLNIK